MVHATVDFETPRDPNGSQAHFDADSDNGHPPASSVHEFDELEDPARLLQLLREERLLRLASEQEKRELEERYKPVAISQDVLTRTIAEGIRQVGRTQLKHAARMPLPGSQGAPDTFTGASAKALPGFFKKLEACFFEAEVDNDRDRISHLLKYVSPTVGEWLQDQEHYAKADYKKLKESLLTLFNNPEKSSPYTRKDLEALVTEYARTDVTHEDILSERIMVFDTMSAKLIKLGKLSSTDRDRLYFKTFTAAKREAI
ncbi:hypothetical protein M408DRAFT_80106, partial [Serendipita vermifera MAFF 305830]